MFIRQGRLPTEAKRSYIVFLVAIIGLFAKLRVAEALPTESGCTPFDAYSADLRDGKWYFPDSDRSISSAKFTIRSNSSSGSVCALRRVSVEEARTCLRGKHVVLVGDSMTRHQFESLVIWIESGKRGVQHSNDPIPFVDRSAVFDESRLRVESYRSTRSTYNHSMLSYNRYYYNPELDLNITALGMYAYGFGHAPVGWAPPGTRFSPDYEWSFTTLTGIAAVIKKWFGSVDVIQANVGIWALPLVEPETHWNKDKFTVGPVSAARDELEALGDVIKKDGTAVWATRSLIRDDLHDAPDHHYYLGAAYAAARQLGWKILDRHGLTKRLHEFSKEMGISPGSVMTDRMHYYPFLNDEMNNLLLSMVCQHL